MATLVPAWEAALAGMCWWGWAVPISSPSCSLLPGQQKDTPENLAFPAITTMGYAGVPAGPALIGFLAHSTSLTTAFTAASMPICESAGAYVVPERQAKPPVPPNGISSLRRWWDRHSASRDFCHGLLASIKSRWGRRATFSRAQFRLIAER